MRRALVSIIFFAFASCNGGGAGSKSGYPLSRELASAIPADTVALFGGRLDLVQQSPAFAKLQPALSQGMLDAFTTRVGLDPRKDIKEFISAFNGRDAVVLVTGAFQGSAVIEKISKESGAERKDYQGRPVVVRGDGGVALLANNIMAIGPVARVHECVDRLAKSAKLEDRWATGLAALPAQAQLFVLSTGGATLNLPRGSNLSNIDKVLASVENLRGWADLSKSVHLNATASAKDDASAKQLHTQLRGLIGMGRLSTPDNKPELLKFYDAVQTKLEGKNIDFDLDLPLPTLEILLQQFRP